ncbi:mammalian cell entry protein [Mycolicibacterium hippocampi]|uniref:Mce associated protein n=1 Tax=Mycolicibacterium hippocampi TaxID=659824 RepID=A0A7I9ZM24_9MYCO|nr:mammalian cell entry protein [Mycolicibacterium hippocampi]GFH02080.1 Mce associated protein [Mycolicibacterium hippocampi]
MSPRRKLEPDEVSFFAGWRPRHRFRWGLPLSALAGVIIALISITLCADVFTSHQTQRLDAVRDIEALGYVRDFMTEFTSPDPFHANDYASRILAQATGDFAEYYRQNQNAILIGVARSEPTTGTVMDAGVSRRNDDGSVDVLVVTKMLAKSTDGALLMERANRWVVTAREEGDRWMISSLSPMI